MAVKTIIFKEEMSRYIFNMSSTVFSKILVLGAVSGLATWLLAYAINHYVVVPFFCASDASVGICLNSTFMSANIAAVLVGIMLVPVLAMVSMKRALLVVIAAVAALWNVAAWVGGEWYVSLILTILAYTAVFAAVSWINRLRGDLAAIIFLVIFVILARLVISL